MTTDACKNKNADNAPKLTTEAKELILDEKNAVTIKEITATTNVLAYGVLNFG